MKDKIFIIDYYQERSERFSGFRYRYKSENVSGSFSEKLLKLYEKIYEIIF